MRKLILATLFLAAAAVPAFAASTVTLEFTEGGTARGPLRATIENGASRSFLTFCVEPWDEIIPNTPFNFTIDDAIYYRDTDNEEVDPLNENTKKVYAAYLNAGSPLLPEWGETNWLEAVYAAQGLVGDVDPDPQADDRVLANYDTSGWELVRVLNPWDGQAYVPENDLQSVLVRVPAPGALLLGSLGMGAVGWLRRRRSI